MKFIYFIPFLLSTFFACQSNPEPATSIAESPSDVKEPEYYQETEYGTIKKFNYKANTDYDERKEVDLFYASEILKTLDKSLIDHDFEVTISQTKLLAGLKDTLYFTIYDFFAPDKDSFWPATLNSNESVSDRRLDHFMSPLRSRYLLDTIGFSAVVYMGDMEKGELQHESFPNFILRSVQERYQMAD